MHPFLLQQQLKRKGAVGPTPNPLWDATSLLMHCDASPLVDSSQFAQTIVPASPGGSIDTTHKKFGAASWLNANVLNSLRVVGTEQLRFGTGDFTLEGWFDPDPGGAMTVFEWRYAVSGNVGPTIYIAAGNLYFYSSGANRINGAHGMIGGAGVYHHIACTRASGVVRLFIDGSQIGSNFAYSTDMNILPTHFGIGSGPAGEWIGHLDEVRVLKGHAAYTSNFTPPAAPFPEQFL